VAEETAHLMAAKKQKEKDEKCLGLNIFFIGMSPMTFFIQLGPTS
jgi:hypothetical protein